MCGRRIKSDLVGEAGLHRNNNPAENLQKSAACAPLRIPSLDKGCMEGWEMLLPSRDIPTKIRPWLQSYPFEIERDATHLEDAGAFTYAVRSESI